jgi:predicted RNase H-like HicB family nuclease
MAECHRYPLRVQQSKLDGWWFIFVDEVPGLGVLGPNYEDLLDRLKAVAGNLFRARGETVTDIKIIPSERPALHVSHHGCLSQESRQVGDRAGAHLTLLCDAPG